MLLTILLLVKRECTLQQFSISVDGWLSGAQRVASPNYNERPPHVAISLLVLHNISLPPGHYGLGNIEAFFTNSLDSQAHPYFAEISHLTVSAHLLIDRLGHIVQFVPFNKRAWHAGESCFQGVDNCNDYSIGIELEGTDEEAYTNEQYRALAAVSDRLMASYPHITDERIVGHSDIAPKRKTDPGPAFDWQYYKDLRQFVSSA